MTPSPSSSLSSGVSDVQHTPGQGVGPFVTVRISSTIANEYESRCPEDIPESVRLTGKRSVSLASARAMLADAEFNGDSKRGPDEMPLHIGNAYRALAKQLRAAIAKATSTGGSHE